jgi:SAM-dependent methyltransferase
VIDEDDLDAMRMARMRWNAPLSQEHAALLLERLAIGPDSRVLDLGCGWGELLLRAVAGSGAGVTGVGVDTNDEDLRRGRRYAAERSLQDRVRVGASHAFGGTVNALSGLAGLVPPGGRLLYGDLCWERTPTKEAADIFGEEATSLSVLVERARTAGWRVLHVSTVDQREWDDFESTWRAGRQEWLLGHPDDPRAPGLRAEIDAQLRSYVDVYRGVLGFAYLVLGR